MSRGNRYFTWDGYYRGPGSGLGVVLLLAAIIYAATHPGVIDDILGSFPHQIPDVPTPTPPAVPSGAPSP